MEIAQDDYLKLLFDGEEMKLLTAKDLNLLRRIFLMGEMSIFLAIEQDFSPSPGLPMKVQEKGEPVPTWWVQQFCDIFGKNRDAWHMILGDNPAYGLSFN